MKTYFPLLAIILFTSCATLSTHSLENTMQKIEISQNVDEAYKLAYKTAVEFSWEITNSDAHMHAFTAKTPQVMSRWEDTVNVLVEKTQNGSEITVKSKLGHTPNAKYVKSYLDMVKSKSL